MTLADMGMTQVMGGTAPMGAHMMLRATPSTVSAGQVSLVASNMGWRTHELIVLPLTVGATAGQRVAGSDGKVSETASLGEASASCAPGTGDGVTAGKVGWVTIRLAPGRYELVCNLPNHYADGMYQELVVT
ncbi:MAG: sulfocyanin-like copper-binding protein [Jatrophihabitantaceae bacterium]